MMPLEGYTVDYAEPDNGQIASNFSFVHSFVQVVSRLPTQVILVVTIVRVTARIMTPPAVFAKAQHR